MNLTSSQLTTIGVALAVCVGVYKLVPSQMVKAAALGVAGTIVARQLPYVGNALG